MAHYNRSHPLLALHLPVLRLRHHPIPYPLHRQTPDPAIHDPRMASTNFPRHALRNHCLCDR